MPSRIITSVFTKGITEHKGRFPPGGNKVAAMTFGHRPPPTETDERDTPPPRRVSPLVAPEAGGLSSPSPHSALALMRDLGRWMLDLLLPPRCLACGVQLGHSHAVCPNCWLGLQFISTPYCRCCGLPFSFHPGGELLCGACLRHPPPFARARAALVYDQASRPLILAFKHGDRTDAAPAFGRWMTQAGAELLADADLLLPVPLHWTRLARRHYNQAALLAQIVAQESGVSYHPRLLRRHHATPSLGTLDRIARARLLKDAFSVPPRHRAAVEGRHVVLVDDVMTSGSTVAACARTLRKAGATQVDVLALARVTLET